MNKLAVFAMALNLKSDEKLIIKFENKPDFTGEIILSSDIKFFNERRKGAIRSVLKKINPYVTDIYIQ